jgi:hypothetical protein
VATNETLSPPASVILPLNNSFIYSSNYFKVSLNDGSINVKLASLPIYFFYLIVFCEKLLLLKLKFESLLLVPKYTPPAQYPLL